MGMKAKDLPPVPGVYRATFSDGRYYIGASRDIRGRAKRHLRKSKRNNSCIRAVLDTTPGLTVTWEVLAEYPVGTDAEVYQEVEQAAIDAVFDDPLCVNKVKSACGLEAGGEPQQFWIKYADGRVEPYPERVHPAEMARICGGDANSLGTRHNHVPGEKIAPGVRVALAMDAFDLPANTPEWVERNREYMRHRRATDPDFAERHREYNRQRYANDPERQREYHREWQRKRRATDTEWAERQRKRKREYERQRYNTDPEWAERERVRKRQYRVNDPEYAERQREYYHQRCTNDPKWVESERKRKREYVRQRYANDAAYAERNRERCAHAHQRRRNKRLTTDRRYRARAILTALGNTLSGSTPADDVLTTAQQWLGRRVMCLPPPAK